MRLRDYQQELYAEIISAQTNDLVQLDTGTGKTPIEAALCAWSEYSIIVAHRNILITQCSQTLAKFGIAHDTISTEFTRRRCMQAHKSTGKNHIRRGHKKTLVASINSLVSHFRHHRLTIDCNAPWLVIVDEAHHMLPDNLWGELLTILPAARCVGFTATPGRMDGESLSRRNGGVFDRLVQCSWLREESVAKLIESGYLSNFRMYSPPGQINAYCNPDAVNVQIMPLPAYERYMPGQQAIIMCPAIKNAEEIAREFVAAGISAASISSKMSGTDVWRVIRAFAAGQIKVLCNVDMVGEGFDVPGVTGLIMARRTASFIMYRQWIGRTLRPAQGKSTAIIVDLVGNTIEHGSPDDNVIWDIDNPPVTARTRSTQPCHECGLHYPLRSRACPECGELSELYRGESVGSHYKTMLKLDGVIIEQTRREISDEKRRQRENSEIIMPYLSFSDAGAGREIIHKIISNLINCLLASGEPVSKVNQFLRQDNIQKSAFWFENFTLADATALSEKKAMKVYKKCLKLK